MNDKLKQLQDFFKTKTVPMNVAEISDVINFIEGLKEKPASAPEAQKSKKK